MSWGAWGRQFSTQEMITQINTSLEAGITTFDHADIYGEYTTCLLYTSPSPRD